MLMALPICLAVELIIYLSLILVFLWALHIRVKRFGTLLSRVYITNWQDGNLSFYPEAAKLTLLKNTLWSLPIYFMSLFTILASITNQLEKIMRDFL